MRITKLIGMMALSLLLFVGCSAQGSGGNGKQVDLKAIGEYTAPIPSVQAHTTLEEVRAAGYALEKEPTASYSDEQSGMERTSYLLPEGSCGLEIAGQKVSSAQFDFMDEQLISLTFNLDADGCAAVEAAMREQYGEPDEETAYPENNRILKNWNFQNEERSAATLFLFTNPEDGTVRNGHFDIGYFWFFDGE